ncbi:hypothetical protein HOY80DRAFT_1001658 [Tuber brumale]|nr:hypothetical protein HOY80DRAFT_1001658 [Tuber brumale]
MRAQQGIWLPPPPCARPAPHPALSLDGDLFLPTQIYRGPVWGTGGAGPLVGNGAGEASKNTPLRASERAAAENGAGGPYFSGLRRPHNEHYLQQAALLKNQTDRHKLSEERILSGAQLMELPDARLKKNAGMGQKVPNKALKTKRVHPQHHATTTTSHAMTPKGPTQQISEDSEVEVLSDEEWNLASERCFVSWRATQRKLPPSSLTTSQTTTPPLHMSLRSLKA